MERVHHDLLRGFATAILITLIAAPPSASARNGVVVIQFDDGYADHWETARPILQAYGLRGSFGVVTGLLDTNGRLTSQQVVSMRQYGHEIHDHTLWHDPAFWGDTANAHLWRGRIDSSLAILRGLGVQTRGWNQPGGIGQGFSEALRDTLSLFYDYAAGRVGLTWLQTTNFHWYMRDDILSAGRGAITSWGYNGGGGDPVVELRAIITKMIDGYARGLVVIPLFHHVQESDSTAWALAQICSTVVTHNLTCVTMREAVACVEDSQFNVAKWDNQIPNPGFTSDRDHNNRPDGWGIAAYATPAIDAEQPTRVVRLLDAGNTIVFGPEKGETILSFKMRGVTADVVQSHRVIRTIDDDFVYDLVSEWESFNVTENWQTYNLTVSVPDEADRVELFFKSVVDSVFITDVRFELQLSTGATTAATPVHQLSQNEPDPFNPDTVIPYTVTSSGMVVLEIHDVRGRRIRTLTSEWQGPGQYRVHWSGRNDGGELVASGVYFYRIQTGSVMETRKMHLIK